jgi:hypothetical protein
MLVQLDEGRKVVGLRRSNCKLRIKHLTDSRLPNGQRSRATAPLVDGGRLVQCVLGVYSDRPAAAETTPAKSNEFSLGAARAYDGQLGGHR